MTVTYLKCIGTVPYTSPAALPDLLQRPKDFFGFQDHFCQTDLLLIQSGLYLGFDLRLGNVVHGKLEADSGQYPGPGRVAFGYSQAVKAAAFGVGCAQEHHHVFGAKPVGHLLDFFLTVQVKGAR